MIFSHSRAPLLGAEYEVLREVNRSGVLCDYVDKGNDVVMLVEFHGKDAITNQTVFKKMNAGTKSRIRHLKGCGVRFSNLDPAWA